MRFGALIAVALVCFGAAARAAEPGSSLLVVPPVGTMVEVTAGQEFYVETIVRSVPAYRLARPFRSSMAGSMRLPFSFSIDETLLLFAGRSQDGRWSYFVPEHRAFTASHGLLGNVLRAGDTVGLRIDGQGHRQWFVDNSNYNGRISIWSRDVKDSDPALVRVEAAQHAIGGAPIERLIYLGVEQNRVRVRYEHLAPGGAPTRDEFTFPLDRSGRGTGAVKGAEFAIRAGPVRAQIVVTKGMSTGIDVILPEEPEPEPTPSTTT